MKLVFHDDVIDIPMTFQGDLHVFVEISCVNYYPAASMTMKSPMYILKLLYPPDGRQTFLFRLLVFFNSSGSQVPTANQFECVSRF